MHKPNSPIPPENTSPSAPAGAFVPTSVFLRVEWRFLLFGMAMAFCSSMGQTYFISLFSAEIRNALSLTHGEFGTYYAIATTCSAITLLWLGKLADTMRVERLAFLVVTCLCLAAMLFSQIFNVITLILGLYMLRLWGQGMTTHTYSTAMARRYVAARGRALSVAMLGMNAAESVAPASIVILLGLVDWRTLWIGIPLVIWLALAPNLRALTRRTSLQDGPGLDGLDTGKSGKSGKSAPLTPAEEDKLYAGQKQWRRHEVLRDGRFWGALLGLQLVPNFTMTGLMFHQIHLASLKGVTMTQWSVGYVLYAACAIMGGLLVGQLVDRFTARRVAPHTMLPIAIACLVLWLVGANWGVALFFIFFGFGAGMPFTAHTSLISELYGTRYLGEIKAVFLPAGVFASALSPMVMGVLIDWDFGLGVLLGLNLALAILAQSAAMLTFALSKPRG